MKIKASKQEYIDVEISKYEIEQIVKTTLRKLFWDSNCYYIKNGNLYEDVEYPAGSHTWYDTELVREATEVDKALELVLIELSKK